MARQDELLALLRPPAHRGPLIAAGAVLFAVGIALEEMRLDEALPSGVHVLILVLSAVLVLGLGLLAPLDGDRPAAHQSVLLVTGLLLAWAAIAQFGELLGADFDPDPAGEYVWTSLLVGALALYPAMRRNSAISAMVAAVAFGVAFLAAANWIFGASSQTAFRWLFLLLAVVLVLVSLTLRGRRPRHSELMVVTAGVATLGIVVMAVVAALGGVFVGDSGDEELLPDLWELIVLVAGSGLIAYGAVDRAPGAAWLGVVHLLGFIGAVSADADDTLLWWPLVLLLLGGGAIAAGLRPTPQAPPEPDGYSVERPLASRTEEELIVRVRNDEPPPR